MNARKMNEKKLTLSEAERMKEELGKQFPNMKFVMNPGVVDLPPINWNLRDMLDTAIKRIQTSGIDNMREVDIVFPVEEPTQTKKNKVRLDIRDKASPLGIIIRDDVFAMNKYAPYAPARFKAHEVMGWAAVKQAEIEEAAKETPEVTPEVTNG